MVTGEDEAVRTLLRPSHGLFHTIGTDIFPCVFIVHSCLYYIHTYSVSIHYITIYISICILAMSDDDAAEFAFSSISGNDDVFRQDTLTSGISSITEQDCSMGNNFQPFEFSDHGTCDYDNNIDPVNNLFKHFTEL